MDGQTIIQTIATLRDELKRNALDPARPPLLLPVTKTQPVERILALREAGVTAIGENRVQEIMNKYPTLSGDFSFHMIGRLQTNKIKYIIGRVSMVQSLDRPRLAESLHAHADAKGLRIPVLIEVNCGGEAQKTGVAPEDAEAFTRQCAKLAGIEVRGLMAVMPRAKDPETLRPLFRQMRALYERLRLAAIDRTDIAELSMGMSGDCLVAAQEGATIVRVGSLIFGERM